MSSLLRVAEDRRGLAAMTVETSVGYPNDAWASRILIDWLWHSSSSTTCPDRRRRASRRASVVWPDQLVYNNISMVKPDSYKFIIDAVCLTSISLATENSRWPPFFKMDDIVARKLSVLQQRFAAVTDLVDLNNNVFLKKMFSLCLQNRFSSMVNKKTHL